VKHVFVETNFLIELVRPFPGRDATNLFARRVAAGGAADVRFYVPWVSVVEAKRTLDRIIREDLGFEDAMRRFSVKQFLSHVIAAGDKQFLDTFAGSVSAARTRALTSIRQTVDGVVADMEIIEPTRDVVQKTLAIYPIKSLPPFDEMALGAVLTKAAGLHQVGTPGLFFCNLNKKDFDPQNSQRSKPSTARAV
jgi:hypothetical protein